MALDVGTVPQSKLKAAQGRRQEIDIALSTGLFVFLRANRVSGST